MRFAGLVVFSLAYYLLLGVRCAATTLRETLPDTRDEADGFIAGMIWMALIFLVCLGVASYAATQSLR